MVVVSVGDRVFVEGHGTGTVKFVGKLETDYVSKDVWCGIKLDSPSKCHM